MLNFGSQMTAMASLNPRPRLVPFCAREDLGQGVSVWGFGVWGLGTVFGYKLEPKLTT